MKCSLLPNQPVHHLAVSHAPWWDGQFERLIGLLKLLLYKTVGQGLLSWGGGGGKLSKVLGIEVTMNNCPFCYLEEDI